MNRATELNKPSNQVKRENWWNGYKLNWNVHQEMMKARKYLANFRRMIHLSYLHQALDTSFVSCQVLSLFIGYCTLSYPLFQQQEWYIKGNSFELTLQVMPSLEIVRLPLQSASQENFDELWICTSVYKTIIISCCIGLDIIYSFS